MSNIFHASAGGNDAKVHRKVKFPERIEVALTPAQRLTMENIAEREPEISLEQLMRQVISRGIEIMKNSSLPALEAASVAQVGKKKSPTPKRPVVENYIGVPLEERLRRRLEEFLAEHPEAIPEEEATAMLIDLGLLHVHRK